jgi:hypothetical protein
MDGLPQMLEEVQRTLGRNQEFGAAVTLKIEGAEHVFFAQPGDAFVQGGWRAQRGQADGFTNRHGLVFVPAQHHGLQQRFFVGIHVHAIGQGLNHLGQLQKAQVSGYERSFGFVHKFNFIELFVQFKPLSNS